VLVHLLALERLAGGDQPADADIDWVALSDQFSANDNEPTMASFAAELLTSPAPELNVTFASGGQLVRGAGAAAASLYSGLQATRVEGNDKVLDRSIAGLTEAGWSTEQSRCLLRAWAARDAASTVVILNLESSASDDAEHELRCRFAVLHNEMEHLSPIDASNLEILAGGSSRLICLRGDAEAVAKVAERHDDAFSFVGHRSDSVRALEQLWKQGRARTSSPSHDQRLRRIKRQALTDQLLERTLGR